MMTLRQTSQALEGHAGRPASSPRFRILFLAPFAPHLQASHGGSRVIAHLIAHLAERHPVGLCYLRSSDEPPVDSLLRERCEVIEEVILPQMADSGINRYLNRLRIWKDLIAGRPLWAIDRSAAAFEERLAKLLLTWQPDIVQIEFHIMGQYLPALVNYPAPRVLIQHEPGEEAAREGRHSRHISGRVMPGLDLLAWKRFEREVIRQVQTVVVFTERDRKAVYKLGQRTPVVRIPLGAEIPEHSLNPLGEGPPSLFFVGNFKHMPNVDAADRLINQIFPQVQSRFPEARLYIVGDHLPANIQKRPDQSIILTGPVPDVTPYLDRAALVVVPIGLGGGMRVKVLEALAAGKAVVASSRAVEGLDVVDGEQVVIAEDDEEFWRAIVDLLGNPDKRVAMADRARAWSIANLSWGRVAEEYELVYRNLLIC